MVTKFETYNVDTVIDMINNVDINSNNMGILYYNISKFQFGLGD